MALFGETKKPFSYDILREGDETILMIDLEQYQHTPSLEDDPVCMSRTMDILAETTGVTKIVYTQKRNYEYDYSQTMMMQEIAKLYSQLTKRRDVIGYANLLADPKCTKWAAQWYASLQNLTADMLKRDPIGAYVELKRTARDERIRIDRTLDQNYINCAKKYIAILSYLMALLEKTKLIDAAKQYLSGYKLNERSVYRRIFTPDIRPDFMFTKLMATFPAEGEEIDSYEIDKNTEVTIFELPDNVQYLYHLIPPEFKLSEEKYEILDTARKIMAEHKPTRQEFIDPERMRQVFYNIGSDLIEELVNYRNLRLSSAEIDEMTKILVRYTVGFGLIEVLLQDERVQDITINSPLGETPMFIVHQDYADCVTNIVPTSPEADSWASKLRLISGRPLDEANPILDTELTIPGANSRIAVVAPPLNPSGLAFAFRRHRDKPWTLPLFIQNKMINPMAAGIMSFLIDGARSMLIAGTRSAGKTSLLGAVLVELMRKYRVITIEDSVTGDSSIIIQRNGKIERTTIGSLIDELINKYGKWYNLTEHEVTGNPENIKVFAMDKQGKIKLSAVSKFIRHKVKKPIYKIRTRTGRTIKVTGDHSLFGLDKDANIVETKANELKEGSFIAASRLVNIDNKPIHRLNLLEQLVRIPNTFFCGNSIKKVLLENKKDIIYLRKELGYSKEAATNWFRKGLLPQQVLLSLINQRIKVGNDAYFSYNNSITKIPINIELNEEFLTFIGLWIADGCYDKNSVIISCNDAEDREIFDDVAKVFNLKRKIHSDKVSYMINSKPLKILMKECLNLDGNAYTKRIPEWVFNLSKEQIAQILKGLFSGDGCATDKEIVIPLSSINLLKDVQFLLSLYGINLRIRKLRKDGTYNASISTLKDFIRFHENIGFLQHYKASVLKKLCSKKSTHDSSDVIPLGLETKKNILKEYNDFKYHDYIIRNNNVGRTKLTQIVELMPESKLRNNLKSLANSDVFWDEIESIELIENFEDFVYDISVPECESFVCENIIAHNTLELPTNSLRKLGYNIQSMKVAAALSKGTSEVPADEGIRTTLRMGDSALIIGEIRSKEALALYEAMRVGALANVVAGTIHGDSPYGVFDRVVNDLGVPRTSFKATDVVVVANPVRSADGLHRWRRVTQITEVRKHWEQDPLVEKGFVDLMKYDSKKDELETSEDLINGDSEILKAIAGNVKEWAGNWDAVWDNILLRAKTKEALVDFANKTNNMGLLEADFVIQSNDQFHKISERIREEIGTLDSKRIFFDWNEWLKRHVK
ncbi:Flp pilus assembly complex ATPase component TadA, partial [Candidatus Woesearchaeota archaeon]|nr:Flp pilus assembly complex ATPase component TadA [Candidatus Woesearchaeota archaeon]